MLYGVFSDVHANLEALEAVLEFFEDFEVDGYICCGDLVGYGPEPNEVLDRLRALKNLTVICGNHDLAVLGRMDLEWFNPFARAAVVWTRERLSAAPKRFLEGLTAKAEAKDFTIVHGTPRKPPEEYLLSFAQFKENMPLVKTWPLFIGHSHIPLCFRVVHRRKAGGEAVLIEDQKKINILRSPDGIIPIALNPGSVGQPRDHDRRASCGLYDADRGIFRVFRIEYDIPAVQAKIRKAGLPEYLALRLSYGQ